MTYRKEFWKLQFARIGALNIIASFIPAVIGSWHIAFYMIAFSNAIGWMLFYVTQKEFLKLHQ
jgi:hypothetical protein